MIYLLYISLVYLAVNSIILWMNRDDFTPLPAVPGKEVSTPVSICIPARNEEDVIERAVRSALDQDHPSLEVIVLDDESSDATPDILQALQKEYPENLYTITGSDKPDNWIGKNWACHQLSEKASGEILIFMDADAWLEKGAVSRILTSMSNNTIDFITVWPMQKLGTFWEKVVIPVIYYGLLTLLPARYVHDHPGWLPQKYRKRFGTAFAAACGQCMVFQREAYEKIGGHTSVKSEIVEDVALAKQIKRNGLRMRMHHGLEAVHCRMYQSHGNMWEGFRKNFLALYNNSVFLFISMALLNCIVYVLPFVFMVWSLFSGDKLITALSFIAIGLIIIQRLILNSWFRWKLSYSISHPLGVLWFIALGVRVLIDYINNIPPRWKDRDMAR